jgi:hypothetical protein
MLREGTPRLLYEDESAVGQEEIVHDFQNLPILALAFEPLARLPLRESGRLWLAIISFAAVLTFLSLCLIVPAPGGRMSSYRWYLLILLLMINFEPLYRSLDLGQTTPLCLLGLCGLYYLSKNHRHAWSGILLAFLFLIKMPFLLPALYFLLKKNYRLFAWFGITIAALVILSVALFGTDLHLQYLENNILLFLGKGLGAFNNQSISGVLIRTFTSAPLASWAPVALPPWIGVLSLVLSGALLLTAFLAVRRANAVSPGDRSFAMQFTVIVCLMLLVFPISWIHYYIFLIPCYLLLAPAVRDSLAARRFGMPVVFFASYILVAVFPVHPNRYYRGIGNSLAARVWCSHFFFGALILLVVGLLVLREERAKKGRQ